MEALERYRGHFYNWYDTQSLKPLQPIYISSVDSGNLAGHLLTLRPGLLTLADEPILCTQWFDGMGTPSGCWWTLAEGASGAARALSADGFGVLCRCSRRYAARRRGGALINS